MLPAMRRASSSLMTLARCASSLSKPPERLQRSNCRLWMLHLDYLIAQRRQSPLRICSKVFHYWDLSRDQCSQMPACLQTENRQTPIAPPCLSRPTDHTLNHELESRS